MHKTLSNVVVKAADKGEVTAVFSTFNVIDKDGDVTVPGAIKDGTEVVISSYGHKSHDGVLPVGKGVIRTTDTEAILDGTFFLNTTAGRDTFEVVKELGALGEWSYSLHNVVSKAGEMDGQPVQFLESISVKEVSPVLIGAGVNTRTVGTKANETLQDQIAKAMDVVNGVIDGVERVVALRTEKGKELSKVNAESLVGLGESLGRLKALLEPGSDESDSETPEDIKAIGAEIIRQSLFSSLTRNGA